MYAKNAATSIRLVTPEALVEAVPEAEVNLVEAAPVVENLPAVKVQNNV